MGEGVYDILFIFNFDFIVFFFLFNFLYSFKKGEGVNFLLIYFLYLKKNVVILSGGGVFYFCMLCLC